ncbi:hypothetical protein D3C72_1215820 [compost metagenome]
MTNYVLLEARHIASRRTILVHEICETQQSEAIVIPFRKLLFNLLEVTCWQRILSIETNALGVGYGRDGVHERGWLRISWCCAAIVHFQSGKGEIEIAILEFLNNLAVIIVPCGMLGTVRG